MLNRAKEMLKGDITLVMQNGEKIYTSCERGIKPLLELFDTGADFSGFFAADKVVGRAAAFVYALMGVRALFAQTVSDSAMEILTEFGIEVEAEERVERILNRRRDGFCPMESAVIGITDKHEALAAIRRRLKELEK